MAYEQVLPSGLNVSAAIKREADEGRGALEFDKIKTTELRLALEYKGWMVSHAVGIDGLLGGEV